MKWWLENAQRGVLLGKTRTGKSTLGTELVNRFSADYKNARILIIDSKPRYRAQFTASGLPIKYHNWVKGDYIPNSVGCYEPQKLSYLYKSTRVVILQSMTPQGNTVEDYINLVDDYIDQLFKMSGPRTPCLVYIDEFYDILGGSTLQAIGSREVLKSIRAGGEKNLAVLAGAQRPRSIPLPILTEADKYYIFRLKLDDDLSYLRKYGIPLQMTAFDHNFVFFLDINAKEPVEKLMRLNLG